jgi:hypothetical protein
MRTLAVTVILFSSFGPLTAAAQQVQAPLQAEVQVRVKNKAGATASFRSLLEGGPALVKGTVQNLPGGDTAFIQLKFNYPTDFDIALDEIISQIVISLEDANGNLFSTMTIDPNTIHLNPNRVPLYYSATLYRSPRIVGRNNYIARVQVFGNYE